MRYFKNICIISCMMFISSCKTVMNVPDERNMSSLYNPSSTSLHPAFMVYHENEEKSILTVKLFPSELLYNKANVDAEYRAKVRIDYELFEISPNSGPDIVSDSASHEYIIKMDEADQRFFADIPVQAKAGKEYMLRVYTTDLLRRTNVQSFFYIDKTSELNNQNFIVRYKNSDIPVFDPKVVDKKPFTIFYNKKKINRIFVKYYKNDLDLPSPTFSSSSDLYIFEKPDSIWVLPYSDTLGYSLGHEGRYHFQVDTTEPDGVTLFNFANSFPRITTPDQLVDPLAYLVNSYDFTVLQKSKNKKLAVDEFWLGTTDNLNRARELIRIYYNRVFFSNYYFTSGKEGWKTDRGMIYTVYGQPNTMYKSSTQEKWVYYDKNKSVTITFVFNKVYSPFSNNEFVLQRGEELNTHWRRAVLAWRNGEIFSLDK